MKKKKIVIHDLYWFESISVPENNRKQNPDVSYTDKYQNHVAYSLGYKLVCVDDQFSNPFKSKIGQDAAYKFITSMVKESKYCNHMIQKHFNKEVIMTKEDDENFHSATKCSIWYFKAINFFAMKFLRFF